MTYTEHQKLIDQLFTRAKSKGATDVEVNLGSNQGFYLNVRQGDLETVEHEKGQELDITVYFGQQKGSASCNDFSEKSLSATVDMACDIARYTEIDTYSGLAPKEFIAKTVPELNLEHPWSISIPEATELAKQCETLACQYDKRIHNSDGVSISSYQSHSVYANTHDFFGVLNSTRHDISCVLLAKENNHMERDGSFSIARDPNDLWSLEKIANDAAVRTVKRLNARRMKTTQAPVLFAPEAARTLWKHLISALSGSALYRQSSFLLNQLGKMILPNTISIHENPHLLKGLGSSPFDSDGVATTAKDFITQGELVSYALGVYSARHLGMETTGNADGVHNITIETELTPVETLIKQMQRGLIVTELMGQGINLITGDYSRGACGFWVENGEIQYPVHEVTIAGNLKDMFQHIAAVGDDIDTRGNIQTGSVLVENMMIAGE